MKQLARYLWFIPTISVWCLAQSICIGLLCSIYCIILISPYSSIVLIADEMDIITTGARYSVDTHTYFDVIVFMHSVSTN